MVFFLKITKISDKSNQLHCETVAANLNEAFAQLEFTQSLNPTYYLPANLRTSASTVSFKFNNNITIAEGVTLNGEILFSLSSVKFEYKKKLGSLKPEKFVIQTELTTEGSKLEINNKTGKAFQINKKKIRTVSLPTLKIPIPVPTPFGIIPILIPFSEAVTLNAFPLKITAGARWVVVPKCTATLGMKYENEQWTNLSQFNVDGSSPTLVKADFVSYYSLEADVDFSLDYELYPFNFNRLRAIFSTTLNTSLTLRNTTPEYSLKLKGGVKAGIVKEFFTGEKDEYVVSGSLFSKTLLEGDWPKTVPRLQNHGINDKGSLSSMSAVAEISLYDTGGEEVTKLGVCVGFKIEPKIGDDNVTVFLANSTSTGTYYIKLLNLLPDTVYNISAFATNKIGTSYGGSSSSTTFLTPVFSTKEIESLKGVYKGTFRRKSDNKILETAIVIDKAEIGGALYGTGWLFVGEKGNISSYTNKIEFVMGHVPRGSGKVYTLFVKGQYINSTSYKATLSKDLTKIIIPSTELYTDVILEKQ